jgi:hypothetical protein
VGTAGPRTGRTSLIFHKGRSFRIPFKVDADGRTRLKEVQLWYSEDSGFHWKAVSKTTPDRPSFTFRGSHDGEYWFAVRTLSVDGQFFPPIDDTVEPNMKVVIDTTPPSLVLEPDGRKGSLASVRWEAKDEYLDLRSLVIEYQPEGSREWRRVPLRRPATFGAQSWDAGTIEVLRVRASIADKAGNVADATALLPDGSSSLPAGVNDDRAAFSAPPPISQVSDSPLITAGPGFSPVDDFGGGSPNPAPRARGAQRGASPSNNPNAASGPKTADLGNASANPAWDGETGSGPERGDLNQPNQAFGGPNAFSASNAGGGSTGTPGSTGAPAAGASSSLVVPSPRFALQYAVEDAGPSGPASVELWLTQDGGRTWIRRGEDPDRTSPFDVDLGGEGTFGLRLVARSASGFGDQPPAPGDPPDTWVEVDSSPPSVQLDPPQIGSGPHAGKVAVSWRATDLHLAPRSVTLSWRPDQPGTEWQTIAQNQENSGQFVWVVPPTVPPRFHIRVEATDTMGHQGRAETSEASPVIVDRSRPRSRIIGLDPSARAGVGPAAHPLR